MKVELLAIGDEILSGDIVNTNVAFLSEALWLCGFIVGYHSAVRDDPKAIRQALLLAAKRASLVIVTGGLGPTGDDFTIEIAAKTFHKKLVQNNLKQALIPKGAKVYLNPVGCAPGVGLKFKGVSFYFLPGVPKEMKALFEKSILPEILANRKKRKVFKSKLFRCFGMAEAELDYALNSFYHHKTEIGNVRVGFRAHFPETLIKLSSWGKTEHEAQKFLEEGITFLKEKVGKAIYGEGEESLESVLGFLLSSQGKTVSVAESCTGGLIANRITNVSGSSSYFKGGVVAYDNQIKKDFLGVQAETLQTYGAVSRECACEMAKGVQKRAATDFSIAVTGIAGPTGATAGKPVGTVFIALAKKGAINCAPTVVCYDYCFKLNREWFKSLVASLAMNHLRLNLITN